MTKLIMILAQQDILYIQYTSRAMRYVGFACSRWNREMNRSEYSTPTSPTQGQLPSEFLNRT